VNVAFLFNSDHPSLGSYYGPPVMDRILGAQVLQTTNRRMRVSLGDILTYGATSQIKSPTITSLIELCQLVYQPMSFDRLIYDRLVATHGKVTVFCWLIQNILSPVAEALHAKLSEDPSYLGVMDVDFSRPIHLYFFRNSLCEKYRLHGKQCSIFYTMSHNEDPDIVIRERFERHGFTITYEDIGARRTIFDNYDTLEHFKRVEDFKLVFSEFDQVGPDRASDLSHSIEELHPKLFDAFASAARTLQRAETEEDYAQAALSGRRLLEKTADYLFPPREEKWNGRQVGRSQYKNRLWAYVEQTIKESTFADQNDLIRLGNEADRLVDLFNEGLHADPTKEKVKAAFSALVIWLSEVIELSPEAAHRPYLAYQKELVGFLKEVTGAR
jgi:hypothetical protein